MYGADVVGMIVAFRGIVKTGNPFGTTGISSVVMFDYSSITLSQIITSRPTNEYVVAFAYYVQNTDMTGWTNWMGPASTKF